MDKVISINTDVDNIKLIKTNDGIDYIGRVSEMLGKVIVEKCLGVFVQEDQTQHGSFRIGFMPPVHPALSIINENARGAADLEFQATAIKFMNVPNAQMLKMYREASSGIEIAKIMPSRL